MTPKVGGGRPWGPIRAENPAARKLAETLRRHVDDSGKTLAVLSGEISMSKAQTGVYLAGKLPTQAFIAALIRATVRPELRQRRQEEALALREQAMRPTPRTTPGAPVAAGPGAGYAVELAAAQARQIETYDRLTRTLEQRADVERAKNNSDKLVMVLLNMIHQLDRRVTDLAKERDQLLTQPRSEALEDAERKLARAEEQEQRARAELRRAEEKQRQAEDLEARVQDQLRRLTDELDRLRAGDTTSPVEALPVLADEPSEKPYSADPVGDDIDAVLARAGAVNEEDNTTLNRVTSELNEPTAEVVQDNPPDNPTSPESLNSRHGHAVSVAAAGNPGRAAALFNELIPEFTRALGADHPHTLHTRHNHAVSVGKAGNPGQAASLFNELIPDLTRTIGANHTDTLDTRDSHARNVGKAGDPERAAELFDGLISDLTRTLGPDHLRTLRARNQYAENVERAGDHERASALFKELLPHYLSALGPQHPDTMRLRAYHRNLQTNPPHS
ncbi:tetratricopeptide repeat protein [Streptomyces microflavus]|uniref:tetratricopeptide repeat protein n=1 Tax=Streptomyces microflavus TaxID=1919 RepID=UPI0038218B12